MEPDGQYLPSAVDRPVVGGEVPFPSLVALGPLQPADQLNSQQAAEFGGYVAIHGKLATTAVNVLIFAKAAVVFSILPVLAVIFLCLLANLPADLDNVEIYFVLD